MAGLYIHIPFCKKACHYCDFHFSTNTKLSGDVTNAIAHELFLRKDYLGTKKLDTIYFGGGTPSIIDEKNMTLLFDAMHRHFSWNESCEITLEANPEDLNHKKLRHYKHLGINRLSLGIQSFHDDLLIWFNRSHNADTALRSIEYAYKEGFDNINIDLICAVPNAPYDEWGKSVEKVLSIRPNHVAIYALAIEKNTVFGHRLDKGKMHALDENASLLQLENSASSLIDAGYEHYEVSNFCLPDKRAKHNSNYWKQHPYLGVGPSAHSYNLISRQVNVKNNARYVKAIAQDNIPCTVEKLSRKNKINEYIMTSVRTMWGCNLTQLQHRYDYDLKALHAPYLRNLENHRLVYIDKGRLYLTLKGKFLADMIASNLFA